MEDRTIMLDFFEDSVEIDVARFDGESVWISINRRLASMRAILTKEQTKELIKNLQDVLDSLDKE